MAAVVGLRPSYLMSGSSQEDEVAAEELRVRLMRGKSATGHLAIFAHTTRIPEQLALRNLAHLIIDHGTTTLGFKYDGGIVLAVDSRATEGRFVASQTIRKLFRIHGNVVGTFAGSAADCSYWHHQLHLHCKLYESQGKKPLSVGATSKLMASIMHEYSFLDICMGTMIAGCDVLKGPSIYFVTGDGERVKNDAFAVGSGASYAVSVFDAGFDPRMSNAAAFDLAKRAIVLAAFRDTSTGGVIRVMHLTADSVDTVCEEDCMTIRTQLNI